MNRWRDNARTALVILLGVLMAEVGASAGFGVSWNGDPNGWIGLDPNTWRPFEDRQAQDTYRNEGAEIVPWTPESVLPSPDNAALLYYQAFLLRPEPDEATSLQINRVLRDDLPDASIRVYLGKCRKMIHTVEVASQVPQCEWGIRYLDTKGFDLSIWLGEIRQVAYVLSLDARTLGVGGHSEAAFARCLTIRRVARHVGSDTLIAYLVALAIDNMAYQATQYTLGCTPPTADLLLSVRGQLAALPDMSQSFRQAAQADLNLMLEQVKDSKTTIEYLQQQWANAAESPQARDDALRLTDEEILTIARESSERFLNGVFQIMDGEMPYDQKYAEIDRRIVDASRQPDVVVGVTTLMWNLGVRSQARCNAMKAAVDIYLTLAQTGRLPETLPAYCPKDPFSGQEFEYETTPEGFLLRCRGRDLYEDRIWEYEFKVRS